MNFLAMQITNQKCICFIITVGNLQNVFTDIEFTDILIILGHFNWYNVLLAIPADMPVQLKTFFHSRSRILILYRPLFIIT